MFAMLAALNGFAADVTPAPESAQLERSVEVPASADAILALVSDPADLARVTRTGKLLATEADGACTLDTIWMAAGAGSVEYTVRTCPTADGLHSSLVASDDLERFEADWSLVTVAGGTEVSYALEMKAKDAWFASRALTELAVSDTLLTLRRHFAPNPQDESDALADASASN